MSACKCPDTVGGIHDGDRIRTTVVGAYEGDAMVLQGPRCTGLGDLVTGAMITSVARFALPADGCQSDQPDLTIESTTVPGYAVTGNVNEVRLNVDGGCSGRVGVGFVPVGPGPGPSYYDTIRADGGTPSWLLERSLSPYSCLDGGTYPGWSYCSDLFIANNQRL
jgi:hypothetical protein